MREKLAKRAGFSADERRALAELDVLDQPVLLADRMGGEANLKRAVAECARAGKYTPAHALLGCLSSTLGMPAATTNHDCLFEEAVQSAGGRILRIPWENAEARMDPTHRSPTLLKLHGCAHDPRSIVLSRSDYMRYADTRGAVRQLLSGMLLQQKMLVVGTSLGDENVRKAIDEARKIRASHSVEHSAEPADTYLLLVENVMFRKLWKLDFRVMACAQSADAMHRPSWVLDAFIDCLVSSIVEHSSVAAFIFNPQYESLLTAEQRQLKRALGPLQRLSSEECMRDSQMWPELERILHDGKQSWTGKR